MDLSVTVAAKKPLHLKNPIMVASGTFGYGLEFMPYGDLTALGGIVVKGISLQPRPGNPLPRVAETPGGMLNAIGLQNDGVEAFLKQKLPYLPHKKVPIIANIYAASVEEFACLTGILANEPGIAALEVNISCPNVKEGGVLFGQDAKQAAAVTYAVCQNAGDLPVIVKLSPNVTDIAAIARAVEKAGAHAISCINTLQGMAVDLQTKRPRLSTTIGGFSGPAIKPVALRCVWQVCQAVKIPVIGIGGIFSAEDALEFIMVGAHAVQLGTANFIRPDAAFLCLQNLPDACKSLDIHDLNTFRGSLISE